MTGCGGILPPTCSTTTQPLHHQHTTTSTNFHRRASRGFVLAPNRSHLRAASRRQPTKAGIWRRRWCAGAVLAKVPLISRLESRPTTTCGLSRWEDETLKIGATRQGLRRSAGTSTSCVMSGVTQAAVAGHVSHDVAFTKSWPTGATTSAASRPPRRASRADRQPGHLKIARFSLLSILINLRDILRGNWGRVELFIFLRSSLLQIFVLFFSIQYKG